MILYFTSHRNEDYKSFVKIHSSRKVEKLALMTQMRQKNDIRRDCLVINLAIYVGNYFIQTTMFLSVNNIYKPYNQHNLTDQGP